MVTGTELVAAGAASDEHWCQRWQGPRSSCGVGQRRACTLTGFKSFLSVNALGFDQCQTMKSLTQLLGITWHTQRFIMGHGARFPSLLGASVIDCEMF